jgi:hypothetical protein
MFSACFGLRMKINFDMGSDDTTQLMSAYLSSYGKRGTGAHNRRLSKK